MKLFFKSRTPALVLTCLLAGCGGDSNSGTPTVSTGLKIFVTSRVHDGNFRDDTVLAGTTAIEKADNFCQTDPARPSAATYKALLVDGVLRDAQSQNNWVLKPSTSYFQSFNDVRIGVTTPAAVFATASNNLDHNIHASFGTSNDPNNPAPTSSVWTGLADAATFSSSTDNCQGWSSSVNLYSSIIGVTYGTDAEAFYTNGGHACTFAYRLYCIEQ